MEIAVILSAGLQDWIDFGVIVSKDYLLRVADYSDIANWPSDWDFVP